MIIYRPCPSCRNRSRLAGSVPQADCNYIECPAAPRFTLTFDTLEATGWVVVCPGPDCGIRLPWTPQKGHAVVRCPLCSAVFRVR